MRTASRKTLYRGKIQKSCNPSFQSLKNRTQSYLLLRQSSDKYCHVNVYQKKSCFLICLYILIVFIHKYLSNSIIHMIIWLDTAEGVDDFHRVSECTFIPICVTSGFCHTLGDKHGNERFDTTGSFIAYRITNISHLGCRKTIMKWILTETDWRRCNIISRLWWSQTSWASFHSLWYSIITIPQKNYSFLTNLSLSVTWYGSHEAQNTKRL